MTGVQTCALPISVIKKIVEGPPSWYGQPWGADMTALAAARGTPLKAAPFAFTVDWIRFWLTQNPQFDASTLTSEQFQYFWTQSLEEFGGVIGTDNPDLSAFKARGGKLLWWHGWADQLITAQGSIDFYKRVVAAMGGSQKTPELARFLLAPGVAHCSGGAGPQPYGQLDALRAWVEDGKAPVTLTAARRDQTGAITRSRPLCQYPLVAKYKGKGSTDEADNFTCSAGF